MTLTLPLARHNDSCLVSQMRAQLEVPEAPVGYPTVVQDLGIPGTAVEQEHFYLSFVSL